MPFYELYRPSLGLSTLKAQLINNGIDCKIIYPYFKFADKCGFNIYDTVSKELPFHLLIGDAIFKKSLYGEINSDLSKEYLKQLSSVDVTLPDTVLNLSSKACDFIEELSNGKVFSEYSIIGFTSSFHQNVASLSLAKKLKKKYPEKIIIMGGANCEGIMGLTLHRNFDFLDYVFTGESEIALIDFVNKLKSGIKPGYNNEIPGVVYRHEGRSVLNCSCTTLSNLDNLPIPDYEDYFDSYEKSQSKGFFSTEILFETSRGCWWGSKAQCLFCGLNGCKMEYRSKSPDRALREIESLSEKYNCFSFQAADNVIDFSYFNNLIPSLANSESDITFFYETRSSLTKKQIQILAKAGFLYLQPGIEGLSDGMLKLMRKGVSVITNIQCLRLMEEYGISPLWNIILGFPNDKLEFYEETLENMKLISHLTPPTGFSMMRLDRHSPYFCNPEKYGIENIQPFKSYYDVYNLEENEIFNLAYSFEFDYKSSIDYSNVLEPIKNFLDHWQTNSDKLRLEYEFIDNSFIITDTRFEEANTYTLKPLEAHTYLCCDESKTAKQVSDYLSGKLKREVNIELIKSFLDTLVENKLMYKAQEKYLSLAVKKI